MPARPTVINSPGVDERVYFGTSRPKRPSAVKLGEEKHA